MAITNVGVDFRATPLSEMLTPEISYNQSIKTSSLIKDRVNNIIYPRTGQQQFVITATNKPVIEFQLSNTAFTDHTTPVMLMDIQLLLSAPPTANTRCVVAESICPWFYQIQEQINSALIETVTDADLGMFFRTQWQTPRDTYLTKNRFANKNMRWSYGRRFNKPSEIPAGSVGLAGTFVSIDPVLDETNDWIGGGVVLPDGTYLGPVVQVAIPLSFLAVFSGSSYLPPMATSNVLFKYYCNDINRIFSIVEQTGASNFAGGGPSVQQVQLNTIRMSYDAVITAPAVEDAMFSVLNAGGKVYYPMIHHRIQNDIVNMSGPQGGPKLYLLNCSTSNLVSLYQYFLKDTQLTSNHDPLTYMINPGFGSITASAQNRYYVQIGSKVFPSVSQIQGSASMFIELLKALGDGPLLTDERFYYDISNVDNDTLGQPTFGRTGLFSLGVNMERLIGAVSQNSNAGVSTRGVSGLIQTYLCPASATATAPAPNNFSSLRDEFRLISVMSYLEYLIIERGGVLTTNV